MSHHHINDEKLTIFIRMGMVAGCENDRLLKCWYRSLPRPTRNLVSNDDLVKRFAEDQKRI